MLRRRFLAGTAAVALFLASPTPAISFPFWNGGAGTSGGATVLTTFTFVNTSGSTQAANAPTQMFGLAFKKGDVPSGQYPQMQMASDNTQVPLSLGCYAYWSDNSLRFCAALARCPKSIAGSASLTVNLLNGGSAPTASSRTLTELYNALIQVNMTGAGTTGFNLNGTWNSLLKNDANNYQQVTYVDGPAGKVVRVRTHFVQSGSAHGQLECDHYAQILQDNSGNLGGFRYLPRICQPWYNVDSPSKNWRACSAAPTFQSGAGPTTVSFPWPYAALIFTASGSTMSATGVSAYYRGQGETSGNKTALVPCYLTTSNTLPAGLSGTQLYFALIANAGDTFQLFASSSGAFTASPINSTTGGTGTQTVNFAPTCLHFGSIFGATTGAKFNYIQGAGSIAAESTIRVNCNQTYLRSTKLIPPYDLTLSPTDNAWSYNWDPAIPGPLDQYLEDTGERDDIGSLTAWHARAFYSQSALSDTLVRVLGFASAHLSFLLRDGTTFGPVNVGNPNNSYAGMPTSTYNTLGWQGPGGSGGFTLPPTNNYCMGFSGNDTSHIPTCAYYAYLITGEPQFLDMLLDEANGSIFTLPTDGHRNPTNPTTRYAVPAYGPGSQIRTLGWAYRNIAQAAAVVPATMPDATGLPAYAADMLAASCNRLNDVMTNTLMGSYAITNGLWNAIFSNTNWALQQAWQTGYLVPGVCLAAGIENAAAQTWLNGHATWLEHARSTFGGYHVYNYQEHDGPGGTFGGSASGMITTDAQWAIEAPVNTFSWTNANPGVFTIAPEAGVAWTLTNGDKFVFGADGAGVSWPNGAGFSADTPFYAVNVSGNTCNLSATVGGAGLATSASGSLSLGTIAGPYFIQTSPPASNVSGLPYNGSNDPAAYLPNVRAGVKWMRALGTTGLTSVDTDADARITANSVSFTANPKNALQASF